jgi:hypothetical protein
MLAEPVRGAEGDRAGGTVGKRQTYQEILGARAAPDLSKLVERSSPERRGSDAAEAFLDILKIRETAESEAVPILDKILVENLPTTRIHGFAAAQALFCIGTPAAHQILSRHLLVDEYHVNLAIGYTSHWEMREPLRSRFMALYLLTNVSTNLVLELDEARVPSPPKGRLRLHLTLRNAGSESLQVPDPSGDPGALLFLRDAKGRFIPREAHMVDYGPRSAKYVELKPGQAHNVTVTMDVSPARRGGPAPDSPGNWSVVVQGSGRCFDLEGPGRFDILAMLHAPPLNEAQKKGLKVGETWKGWTGRAASKPISVDIAAGRQADRPAHESLSAYQGGDRNWFNAVSPIVRSTNGIPDLIRELSCPDAKHRDLANEVLRQVYSDVHPQSPTTPTNSAAWTAWWEQAGKTNSAQQLWHNFDSHYQ